jgi:hypothetical protein
LVDYVIYQELRPFSTIDTPIDALLRNRVSQVENGSL